MTWLVILLLWIAGVTVLLAFTRAAAILNQEFDDIQVRGRRKKQLHASEQDDWFAAA